MSWLATAALVALAIIVVGLVLALLRWAAVVRVIARKAAEPPYLDQNNYTLDQAREVRPEQE